MIRHIVRQGECLTTIAREHGMPPDKIWRSPDNEDLTRERPSPHVLNPGDEIVIEDRELRQEECATGAKHTFRKKVEPVWLRLRFMDETNPRADEPYTIKIGALVIRGTTDAEGRLEQKIPPDTTEAVLRLGKDSAEDYILKLGELDPVTEILGVQTRLAHLGFNCEPTGKLDPQTQRALREFQFEEVLKMTGEPDEPTREALLARHES